jgi:proteasome lid subunit RPN8/RPN11
VRISPDLYAELIAHAQEESPNECCGMVAFEGDKAVAVHRATNAAPSPRMAYLIEAMDQYRIEMSIYDAGLDVGAVYHSHPKSEPYPSPMDVNLAFHFGAIYIIVGLAGNEPDVRAYTIRDGEVLDAEILVE